MKPINSIDDPRYVKAMSHPLRVRILALLEQRTASPNEISQVVEATLGTVSYHVRTLAQLGLIELVDETRRRGAIEHHYRAKARPKVTEEAWAAASPIAKQAAIGSSLQMLAEYARSSAAAGGFDRSDAILGRLALKLDAKAFKQLSKACEQFVEKAQKIEAEAAKRLDKDGDGGDVIDAGVAVMLFEGVNLGESGATRDSARPKRAAEPVAAG